MNASRGNGSFQQCACKQAENSSYVNYGKAASICLAFQLGILSLVFLSVSRSYGGTVHYTDATSVPQYLVLLVQLFACVMKQAQN
jgi:hypothetical protein